MTSKFLIPMLAMLLCGSPLLGEDKSDPPTDPKDNAVQKLQGRWGIVGGVNQGRELSKQELAGASVTVTANTIATYDHSQKETYRAVFTIDESKTPIHITMRTVPKNAPTDAKTPVERETEPDRTAPGILKFDGEDKCVLCYAILGADRPKEFKSPEGSKIMLFMLERTPVDESIIQAIKKE